jgi:hypothetical protein
MGYYLSHIENRKADVTKGTFPDENYAREVMQLFTIGLWELNEDGTLQLDAEGKAIPTYDNDDIFEFAKVFTGLRRPRDRGNIEIFFGNYVDPMRIQAGWHDFSPKTLLDGSQLGPFSSNAQGVRNDVGGPARPPLQSCQYAAFLCALLDPALYDLQSLPGLH